MSAAERPTVQSPRRAGEGLGPLRLAGRKAGRLVDRAFSPREAVTRLAFVTTLGLSAAAAVLLAVLAITLAEVVYARLPRDVALAGLFNFLILGVDVALAFCLSWIYVVQCLARGRAMGLGPAAALFQAVGLPVVGATVLTFADGPLVVEAGLALVALPAALFVVLPDRPGRRRENGQAAPRPPVSGLAMHESRE